MQTLQQLLSGDLVGSTRLKISCRLTQFPQEIFTLADTLEILDLSQNQLTHLPNDFGRLSKLKIVFFSDNLFTEFPEVLSQCPHLEMIGFKANQITTISETALPHTTRWLILTNNRLKKLPASVGKCHRMQKLMLAGNQLTELPDELANCKNLGLLRISANNIKSLPGWLCTLPKLSWLAYSGNPAQQKPAVETNTLPFIPWNQLDLVHQLGEGASGIISKALWRKPDEHFAPHEVAVKVFKGEVTSDGLPADEMEACAIAEDHPNLIKVLGKITGHPVSKQGLVLELIPQGYTNLGGPPSFASCTRDVFAEGTSFSLKAIIEIAGGIASAAAHLHAHGIMHGDLYAHNILINEKAHPLFGDFGAATLYNRSDKDLSAKLEALEVLAFGCLLDDLLQHADKKALKKEAYEAIIQLREQCLAPGVSERPDFKQILSTLTGIKEQRI
jgi:hypothetical protein